MSLALIKKDFSESKQILDQFINDEANLEKIAQAGDLMINAIQLQGKILSMGNGGSMCDAMHFAEEMTGRFREDRAPFPAIAIADSSHISCVSNDYGYDEVFVRYVQALGNPNDVILAISTSGNSENVIRAVELGKSKGLKVIGLTGKDGGKLAGMCDIEIRAPYADFADRAQEIHIKVIHSLIHYIEINM